MKKFISVIIALVIAAALCVPAFAASEKASFLVNVLSESDTEAMVSIDYNGGKSFNCLDFKVKLSDRVSIKNCSNGAGLINYKIYVLDLKTSDVTVSSFNDDTNPIKFTFASTIEFKVVNGKDLMTITLNKSSAAKLTADDVKLTVTNCGISVDNGTESIKVNTIQIGNAENATTLNSPNQVGTAEEKTGEPAPLGETTSATQEASSDGDAEITLSPDDGSEITPDENEDSQSTASNKKKIIIIAAVSLCLVLVIAATLIYIVKKAKTGDDTEINN